MKKIFYFGIIAFILYEFFNNYFIMGYPGSQKLDSIELSHFLSYYKIYFEAVVLITIALSGIHVFRNQKILLPIIMISISIISYLYFNYINTAENRFRQPKNLIFSSVATNKVEKNMMILGVEINGQSKAYPIDFIRYHHQIIDSINGKKIMVTYCGLCRTGRVFEPFINGRYTKFRLVGINHHNAMFEDDLTKSWWSQETGISIAGKLKGSNLAEVNSDNMTLQKWAEIHPSTLIMQPDPERKKYGNVNDYLENYENPINPQKGGTWSSHSYIIGISSGNNSKAYEWNYLLRERIINDTIGNKNFFIVLLSDNKSFSAFENPEKATVSIKNDTLYLDNVKYNLAGINLTTSKKELNKVNVYREYWFSWLHAHPNTQRVNF